MLAKNIDFEMVINDLVLLNKKLKDSTTGTRDKALKSLYLLYNTIVDKLLVVLNKLKVKGKY